MRPILRARAYVLAQSVANLIPDSPDAPRQREAWADHVETEILDLVALAVKDARDSAAWSELSPTLPSQLR